VSYLPTQTAGTGELRRRRLVCCGKPHLNLLTTAGSHEGYDRGGNLKLAERETSAKILAQIRNGFTFGDLR